ncbi:unnamed protein product [Didymodactylos carnosus]|uniref:Major facilitator superfamily (MFS) profile domain-containing protein n=1 Tax=Didymodactylos carnosus TaxID=1234261 RepID=A0A813R025_9BILA|nr:unnamed protein product [Didymodactylos carnosus]CAF1017228.1 unnamed protein product [Didymodactylos carnosus]CAF3556998.1 unnamed protein product [Didymodactylos carnosus]CAF3786318.1 unnamed protein product [Didymodactylos carnosus]
MGIVLLIPAFIILGFAKSILVLYIGLLLFSLASAIVINVINSFASKFGSDSEKGTILGTLRSLQALARAIGPFVASSAYWTIGEELTYISGGLLLIFPLILLYNIKERLKKLRYMPRIIVSQAKDD